MDGPWERPQRFCHGSPAIWQGFWGCVALYLYLAPSPFVVVCSLLLALSFFVSVRGFCMSLISLFLSFVISAFISFLCTLFLSFFHHVCSSFLRSLMHFALNFLDNEDDSIPAVVYAVPHADPALLVLARRTLRSKEYIGKSY